MSEKPLHVRVAEALGWTDFEVHRCADLIRDRTNISCGWPDGSWSGRNPARPYLGQCHVPPFDTSWEVTGPLIEKLMRDHHLTLRVANEYEYTSADLPYFVAEVPPVARFHAYGDTPLLAVCNLILALKEAGKLPLGHSGKLPHVSRSGVIARMRLPKTP